MSTTILIVRLGALGDIIHALPVAAALRQAWPEARIDWVVDSRYRRMLDLVQGLDQVFEVGANSWPLVIPSLRRTRYDVAIDLQGLLKSAALTRATGARRVIGFDAGHLREKAARHFYSEAVIPPLDRARHLKEHGGPRRARRRRRIATVSDRDPSLSCRQGHARGACDRPR